MSLSAIVSSDSYASFVLINFPRVSITRCTHAARLPLSRKQFNTIGCAWASLISFLRMDYPHTSTTVKPVLNPGFHMSGKSQTIGDFAVRDRPRFCRYVEKIADHRRKLGRVGKIETLPIFPICPRPSQMVDHPRPSQMDGDGYE